jgi:pyruvate dehydrogenase E2 component (dihydrolipoamide acetyltransferase)
MDLESFHDGYLLHIGVKEGPVPVDGILAVIGKKDEDYKAALESAQGTGSGTKSAEAKTTEQKGKDTKETKDTEENEEEEVTEKPSKSAEKASETSKATKTKEKSTETQEQSSDSAEEPPEAEQTSGKGRIKASPLAKSIARETGVDLSKISGSGDQGRIVKRDVEGAASRQVSPRTPALQVEPGGHDDIALSQMRKTIARRLVESKFSAPHFYLTMEIDMTQAVEDRKRINGILDESGRISFNDIVVKACALALLRHPKVNASWMDNVIRMYHDVHIGVAVAVEDGLLVPVIRNANLKSLSDIHAEVTEMAERARIKRLQPEEMQGNTFTVSNLGMFGIEEFTAIINPPDACILAVGAIVEKPVVLNGTITTAQMMKVTLSCDHRVVDGATGAIFLKTVRQFLESPVSMLA